MIGRRALASNILDGSYWRHFACQKPWSYSFSSFTRAIPSPNPGFEAVLKKPMSFNNISTVSKCSCRFHSTNRQFSTYSRTLLSKLAVAFGVLLGIGGGQALRKKEDYIVACASEGSGCKGNKKDCIEKRCEDSACLRRMDCEEALTSVANAELQRAIMDTKGKAVEHTEAAMKAYCEAISAMCDYLNQAYCIIGEDYDLDTPDYEESWCCVYKFAKKRCLKVKAALEKGECAWILLGRLREVIEAGRECKYTTCNTLLVTAEETLICAERELINLKTKMDCVSSSHEMVEQYKPLIEKYKEDLRCEAECLIANMECCEIKHLEQEMAIMIDLAQLHVVRAQKEMAQYLVCKGRVPERQQCTCC